MGKERPSLADSMKAVARTPVQVIETEAPPAKPAKAASREGKKRATALLSPEEHRRLKRLSADSGDTIEELMSEAVTDLLQKRGA